MSSLTKGLAKEMPSPTELKKSGYRSSEKPDEGGSDKAIEFAEELASAIQDGDGEAIVAALRALKKHL